MWWVIGAGFVCTIAGCFLGSGWMFIVGLVTWLSAFHFWPGPARGRPQGYGHRTPVHSLMELRAREEREWDEMSRRRYARLRRRMARAEAERAAIDDAPDPDGPAG